MKKFPMMLLSWLMSVSLTLTSCTLSAGPALKTSGPALNNTAAAETIMAQLTQIAQPATPTIDLTITSSPVVTEVLAIETLPNTSTPLPTNTPIPTETLIPTDTPTSQFTGEDPRAELGEPDWQDTFTSAASWPVYTDDHIDMELTDNGLTMTALNPDKYEAWMVSWPILSDFYLEVTATPGDCSGLDRYGMLVRAAVDAKAGYFFGFTCDGKYSLRIWDGTKFIKLIDWTASEYILAGTGQTNRLGIKIEGEHISLYANGHLLAEKDDATFSEGAFGLFTGSVNTSDFSVEFSEVAYWEIY